MTAADFLAILPLLVLVGGLAVILVTTAFVRRYNLIAGLTLVDLLLAFGSIWLAWRAAPRQVTPLLILDKFALFYMGLLIAGTAVVVLFSHGYWLSRRGRREEYYSLLLLATTGACILVASSHFASFFLGLELLSVSLYALIAYDRHGRTAIEAGTKYLILAGVSSSFLLLGMALVYAMYGSMNLFDLAQMRQPLHGLLAMTGLGLIIVGVGFKLAVVPFHLWTPDVYQGAPAPLTAYVATVSKGGMFALLLRYFQAVDVQAYPALVTVFVVIAVASMLAGNLLALLQENLKRLLAYSSISHLGYLLVAFLAGGSLATVAVSYYLAAYFVTTLGAFGVVSLLSSDGREAEELSAYRGLFWRRPLLAAALTAMMLSLAGIPVTAGFVGKFFILTAGISSQLWLAVVVLVISSAIGLYYYLRVVVALYRTAREAKLPALELPAPVVAALPLWGVVALAAMVTSLVILGVYPSPTIHLIENVSGSLAAMLASH